MYGKRISQHNKEFSLWSYFNVGATKGFPSGFCFGIVLFITEIDVGLNKLISKLACDKKISYVVLSGWTLNLWKKYFEF